MEKFYIVVSEPVVWQSSLMDILKEQNLITNNLKDAQGILVFGGDGTMLRAIRNYWKSGLPFFGLNFGTVGFLTNQATGHVLQELISDLYRIISVRLLKAQLYNSRGEKIGEETAFNDFYMEKTSPGQAVKIRVIVDNEVRFDPLICNGILVCTPAGSTAYNLSAGGKVLPIDSKEMVLTGICPQKRDYRWESAILPSDAEVIFEAVETEKRSVVLVSDNEILPGVVKASIRYSDSVVRLAFAQSQDFREKVLRLSF